MTHYYKVGMDVQDPHVVLTDNTEGKPHYYSVKVKVPAQYSVFFETTLARVFTAPCYILTRVKSRFPTKPLLVKVKVGLQLFL